MNKEKKVKREWIASIEIPGYIFVIFIFLSIWVDSLRWKLFFTGIFFLIWTLLSHAVHKDKKEKEKKEKEKK